MSKRTRRTANPRRPPRDGYPGSERAGLPEAEGVEEAGEGDGEPTEGVHAARLDRAQSSCGVGATEDVQKASQRHGNPELRVDRTIKEWQNACDQVSAIAPTY